MKKGEFLLEELFKLVQKKASREEFETRLNQNSLINKFDNGLSQAGRLTKNINLIENGVSLYEGQAIFYVQEGQVQRDQLISVNISLSQILFDEMQAQFQALGNSLDKLGDEGLYLYFGGNQRVYSKAMKTTNTHLPYSLNITSEETGL